MNQKLFVNVLSMLEKFNSLGSLTLKVRIKI